jgi:hypothetical protein
VPWKAVMLDAQKGEVVLGTIAGVIVQMRELSVLLR